MGGGPPRRSRAGLRSHAHGPSGSGRRVRLLRLLWIGVALAGVMVAISGSLVVYAAMTLPGLDALSSATGTIRITDRHGTLLAEVGQGGQQRATVPISQIAPIMQEATVAAEDRNFYTEGALDPARILKALVVDVVLRRPAQGASTITEQLAKEAFFGQGASKSLLLKLREALLAQEISGTYSKQQVLDMYLNLTYYGQNAYGVQDAAERYFGKPAAELNLSEAALLAGLPEAPSANDPYLNPGNAFNRMHYVLIALVATGKVSQADAQAVDPLNPDGSPNAAHQASMLADLKNGRGAQLGPAPHFIQYVEDQLPELLQDDPGALRGNLTVTTTLDLTDQQKAVTAVQQGLPQIGHQANNAALLMMDPSNGEVLAWVGSASYSDPSIDGQEDFVTLPGLQPGSSFKPYVYETGFKNGTLTPQTILQDTAQESRKLGGVQDWDRRYEGNITAADALLHSRNIPTEQAAGMIGMPNIIDFAHSLGITTPIADNLGSAIGDSATSVIDQGIGYSAFANGGHTVSPQAILQIKDGNGDLLWSDAGASASQSQPMTPPQAWAVTNILRGYPAYWHLPFRWPTAGKSGTTDSYVDAWYVSYTPSWVVVTWVGNTDGAQNRQAPMDGVFGTTGPGLHIAAPFVNSLPRPAPLQAPPGAAPSCPSAEAASGSGFATALPSGCATPTPTSTPTPTPTRSASPSPTPTPTTSASPLPAPSISLAPTPTSSSAPTPTPSPGGGGPLGGTPTPPGGFPADLPKGSG